MVLEIVVNLVISMDISMDINIIINTDIGMIMVTDISTGIKINLTNLIVYYYL